MNKLPYRVSRKEGCQARHHADRAHARPTSSVRDAECLMQIQVAHICADVAGACERHLGVHVGSVHVYLGKQTNGDEVRVTARHGLICIAWVTSFASLVRLTHIQLTANS